jgi:aminomethyltransferase
MVDFAGWSMPVQYTSIADEHKATRNAVGVFDISHMGRLFFFDEASPEFVDSLVTRKVVDLKPDQIRYALACNEQGGILDDVLVYGGKPGGQPRMIMVVNAGNRTKIVDWINKHSSTWKYGKLTPVMDYTVHSAMIAVQGPKAAEVLVPFFNVERPTPLPDIRNMRYYHYSSEYFDGLISRTGYTGEDGFEIICKAEHAPQIWQQFVDAAKAVGGMPGGLGARDTLRLEAAMPLYDHELTEAVNPIQAGLNFAVNLTGRDFIGRGAIERFADDKSQPVRIGLQVEGKRVPRQGCPVLQGDEIVGEVTSGTFSPTFERSIAMAYVRPTAQAIGTHLAVDIRGTKQAATVVPLPFYERGKKT